MENRKVNFWILVFGKIDIGWIDNIEKIIKNIVFNVKYLNHTFKFSGEKTEN